MTIHAIGIAVTIFIAWSGFLVGVIRYLLKNNTIDKSSQIEELKVRYKELEVKLAELQKEIPLHYVRKSEFIRCKDHCAVNKAQLDKKHDELLEKIYEKIDDLAREMRYAKTQ